jgi:hypothetical protein
VINQCKTAITKLWVGDAPSVPEPPCELDADEPADAGEGGEDDELLEDPDICSEKNGGVFIFFWGGGGESSEDGSVMLYTFRECVAFVAKFA